MLQTTTQVETAQARQYLYKLCKHFARKITVEFDDEQGVAHFPFGACHLRADHTHLSLLLDAPDAAQLQRLQQVLEQHLQLMRRAPDPALSWSRLP